MAGLRQSGWRNRSIRGLGVVLYDDARGALKVRMNIHVALPQVSLVEYLILLDVPPSKDEITIGGDKPYKLLEPQLLPYRLQDGLFLFEPLAESPRQSFARR